MKLEFTGQELGFFNWNISITSLNTIDILSKSFIGTRALLSRSASYSRVISSISLYSFSVGLIGSIMFEF